MLSWIVLIIALALFAALGFTIFSQVFGRGEAVPPMMSTEDVNEANRRAVEDGNFDEIQLEVVHRGYRMDQVDALIAQLTGQNSQENVLKDPAPFGSIPASETDSEVESIQNRVEK